ncbi:MAG: RNA polymerase sporulation sigma factor SigK [Clostridiaceae bacterium]|nr:RNA polymerase sporulation sigma factor SigK [Clostridiaceae bacterium]MCI9484179.1 RNA polymerase sporulation sigma factor SigK [Clostridiaceae bacterium]NBH79643.1 sigma-70 family RNA polymerase sigma factor [Clostridiaceae bacterium]NBI82227.1 sigma-70 family RNA polymerase sigma factor [Clostridiaceae bacterium]RKJ81080.1 sigma-70 family RNA polymerase sigma factor [Butyricicoccus sp. 1XD8-22]
MFLSFLPLMLMHASYFILRVQGSGGAFPKPLSAQEEGECLERFQAGDQAARNKLVEHNLRLVAHIVKKYYADPADQDDLISIGTIGLIKAVSTFKPEKNARLATYAARCIENEILMYFRSLRKSAGDVSLNETLDADGEGGSLALLDTISCEDRDLERVDDHDHYKRVYETVERLLDHREKEIIIARYGLYGGEAVTQREIAKRLGISRSYISRIEKKALAKLAGELREDF